MNNGQHVPVTHLQDGQFAHIQEHIREIECCILQLRSHASLKAYAFSRVAIYSSSKIEVESECERRISYIFIVR